MDMGQFTISEHLVQEIEPMMMIADSLMEKVISLVEKYHINLDSDLEWEKLPSAFQDELQMCILSDINEIPTDSLLNEFIQSGSLYQVVFDKLEVQYSKVDKNNTSYRSFIQHLMEDVMKISVTTEVMSMEDWHKIIEDKKEAYRLDDVAEHVYKKMLVTFRPKKEICIYDFFYNKTSTDELEKLLCETKDSLLLAFTHRELTKKRGQGMSRFIVDCVHEWQNTGLMKPLKSVYPFCQCLQLYWNNEINLGTRQGLEATYKQRL